MVNAKGSIHLGGLDPHTRCVVLAIALLTRRYRVTLLTSLTRESSGTQKRSHAIQLRLEFALEGAIARWARCDIAELRLKLTVLH